MKPKIMLILTENWTIISSNNLRELVDWAVIAEQAGIDGVMLSEHIGAVGGSQWCDEQSACLC